MAKKKYTPKNGSDDGLRPEERVAQKFAEQLIERLEGAKLDWKQPWFSHSNTGAPQNFDGRRYNGMNQFFLALKQEEMGYQLPVWITFQRAKQLGVNVNKGEKSMTVWLGSRIILDKDGKKIPASKYENMSEDEKKECSIRPFAKAFTVFNIQQTNYPELHPEEYSALKEKMMVRSVLDETGMIQVVELDDMIKEQTWVCPINLKQQDDAFYSISKDSITVPLKGQFVDGESFYKTLLHEMAHSTGADNRLDRLKGGGGFGSSEYAREELVAEMTAAVVANTMGFSSGIKDDSVAYLQSWLDALKESPKFMLTVMKDVNKACVMIESHIYNKAAKLQVEEEMEDALEVAMTEDVAEETSAEITETAEPEQKMAVPERKPEYRIENDKSVPVYGQQMAQPKLHKAFLGNGITIWEDGDIDYTGHISPDRKVRFDKEFTPANKQAVERLAEFGNMTYNVDDKTRKLILQPLNMATHLLPNKYTGEMYPVTRELLDPDKPESAVYCTGRHLLDDDISDRLVEIKYPREYVFSITGMDNIRPVFYKLAKQGMDLSYLDVMLEMVDNIIERNVMSPAEREDKVLYFRVKDNKIEKFNRMVDEVGPELPRYWFHDNRLAYNHPGKEAARTQSDAQILAGGEAIIRVNGTTGYHNAIGTLADKGIAMLPKLEAEMRLLGQAVDRLSEKQQNKALLYLFVKDGVVVDTEPNINEKDYDLPKFIFDGMDFHRWHGKTESMDKDIINHLNNKNMEQKQENNQEAKKEVKDGIYVFPMKSGDWGINEVKNGVATPTIRIDRADSDNFKAVTKDQNKEVRNEEIKKLAAKYLTPENIAAAQERKAKREQEAANGEKKESNYVRLPEAKPEVRARIENARAFLMADKKTWASSADIDGAHMSKPMGEKLQNTFLAKLGAINSKDGESKGQSPEAKEQKKELYINTAAMTFHKELSAPKQDQEQSAGMKR